MHGRGKLKFLQKELSELGKDLFILVHVAGNIAPCARLLQQPPRNGKAGAHENGTRRAQQPNQLTQFFLAI